MTIALLVLKILWVVMLGTAIGLFVRYLIRWTLHWILEPSRWERQGPVCCPHCGRYQTDPAWIGWRAFRGIRCRNCGEITLMSGWLLQQVFLGIFARFWDGSVWIGEWTSVRR